MMIGIVHYLGVVVLLWAVLVEGNEGESPSRRPLTENILHYEPLSYSSHDVRTQHYRIRRSLGTSEEPLQLSFIAFDKNFTLNLRPNLEPFSPDVKFAVDGANTGHYDPGTFYRGKVVGDSKSRVSGHVIDGVFDGVITTSEGEFYLEHTRKFFREKRDFHSVIYRREDVEFTQKESSCAAKGEILKKMHVIQASAKPAKHPKRTAPEKEPTLSEFLQRERQKRSFTVTGGTFCQVLVAADHLFHNTIGGGNPTQTITEIVTVFSQVQDIFSSTDFDSDGTADNIVPLIATIDIMTQDDEGYRFSSPNIDVSDYLDIWSQIDHSAFCLALLLTYRDFDGGVLGLAWVAQPAGGNRGGICENRVQLSAGNRYLNTAIVTFLNYGSRQPRPVSVITIAHELGHNFGSPHDPSGTSTCSPGGSRGNFIMYPRATDGTDGNNDNFSPCSVDSILPVLRTKSECFSESGTFCGNAVIEDGEECDCGDEEQCAGDPCCDGDCMLFLSASCSAQQPCCDDQCRFLNSSVVCQEETECALSQTCDGLSGTCPNADPKSGLCNDDTNLCIDGECSGSVCLANGLQDCQCTDPLRLCDVCCISQNECTSTFTLVGLDVLDDGLGQFREPGRSCNNFNGYCSSDDEPICITVDNEQTLNDLLDNLNVETLNNVAEWLIVYWYVPVAVFVALLILIILLHVTYRRRQPIKKGIRNMRNSIRGRGGPSSVGEAQTGGVGEGAAARRRGPREISQREAIGRLRQFFPTADAEILLTVIRASSNESKAVRRMLDLGYPFKKVPIPRA